MQGQIEFRIFMESYGRHSGVPRVVGKGKDTVFLVPPWVPVPSFLEYVIIGLY